MQEYLVHYFQLFPATMHLLKQALGSKAREDDESFAALGLGVVNIRTSLNGFFRNKSKFCQTLSLQLGSIAFANGI